MSENPEDQAPLAGQNTPIDAENAAQLGGSPDPADEQAPPAAKSAPAKAVDAPLPTQELSLAAQIEGLLFVASEAVGPSQLAEALDAGMSSVEVALKELDVSLRPRGLRLQRHSGRVLLTTAPELAESIEKFLGLESTSRLSRAALETLAIIAYQQPITHPQIDAIRGVNSDSMLKSLLNKGLIYESGRADGPGRPILYVTAPSFLQHLGLNSIAELPPLELAQEVSGHDELLKS